jgi:phage gp36-like protein
MPYSTQATVQIAMGGFAKLVQATDQDGLLNAVDPVVLGQAINEADGIINSYLRKQFAVPLVAPIPDVISNLSAAWAARNLRRNLYKGLVQREDADQEVVDREWLMAVAEGKLMLDVAKAPPKAEDRIDSAQPRDSTMKISSTRLRFFG